MGLAVSSSSSVSISKVFFLAAILFLKQKIFISALKKKKKRIYVEWLTQSGLQHHRPTSDLLAVCRSFRSWLLLSWLFWFWLGWCNISSLGCFLLGFWLRRSRWFGFLFTRFFLWLLLCLVCHDNRLSSKFA